MTGMAGASALLELSPAEQQGGDGFIEQAQAALRWAAISEAVQLMFCNVPKI